jgi:phosphatidylethanolamine/phosphatidyl-N-methylethanolamine N-methyltransferase
MQYNKFYRSTSGFLLSIFTRLIKIKTAVKNSNSASFFYEFLKSPGSIGSIYPSSKKLAAYMAQQAILNDDRIVVELGAGTGIITAALLKHGVKPEQLIVIEKSPRLAKRLQTCFPNILVLEEDAINLIKILVALKKLNVGTVISSLPLRSLPAKVTQEITMQIYNLLDQKGKYVQFTYDIRKQKINMNENFYCANAKTIWLNFPPALVNTFTPNFS